MRTPVRLCLIMRAAVVVVLGTMVLLPAGTAAVATPTMLASVNAERARVGVAPLARSADLDAVAVRWTRHMAAAGVLSHNPLLSSEVTGWRALAENVGYGGSEAQVHQALMGSAGHRTNILNRAYTQVGIGVVSSGGRVWVTQVFRTPTNGAVVPPAPTVCPSPSTAPSAPRTADTAAIHRRGAFFLRVSSSDTVCFSFGRTTDVPVMGDWDGNGSRTAGVFRAGAWYLRNANGPGAASIAFSYGRAGDLPVVGDWNGDGVDTVGIVRAGAWHLRDSNSTGPSQRQVSFGRQGDVPVVGDWDGDGVDTVGIRRAGQWHLRNSNTAGAAHHSFSYGIVGDDAVTGDWDGNGADSVGVFRSGKWLLTNSLAAGPAQTAISFGILGDRAPGWR